MMNNNPAGNNRNPFGHLKIRSKILLGFSVPMLLMVLVSYVVYGNVQGMIKTSKQVGQTDTIVASATELGRLIVDMESGELGFLITGKTEFLEPFNHARDIWAKKVMSLKTRLKNQPEQLLLLNDINALEQTWHRVATTPQTRKRFEVNEGKARMADIIALVESQTGKQVIDDIKSKLDHFIAVENDLYQQRNLAAEQAAINTIRTTLSATTIAIAIGVLTIWLIAKAITRNLNTLLINTRSIAAGDFKEKLNLSSKDEVGQLGYAFDEMVATLQHTTVSRAYVDNILKAMSDCLIVVTLDGYIETVNRATCQLLGYSRQQLVGQPISLVIKQKAFWHNRLKQLVEQERIANIAVTYISSDGREVPMSVTGSQMTDKAGRLTNIVTVSRDISEIQHVINELDSARAYSEKIITTIPSGLATLDQQGRVHTANPELTHILGEIPPDQQLCARVGGDPLKDTIEQVISEGTVVRNMALTLAIAGKNDKELWVSIAGLEINAEEKQAHQANVLLVFQDITERTKAQQKFQSVVEAAPDAIVIIDQRGHIAIINKQAESLFGYKKVEMLGQPVEMLIPPAVRDTHVGHRQNYGANPVTRAMGMNILLSAQHQQGHQIPVEVSLSPINTDDGIYTMSTIRDVTERQNLMLALEQNVNELKQTQSQLVQSGKLSAVGELAAGVAHEINNPLSGVMTYSILLKEKFDAAPDSVRIQLPKFSKQLEMIEKAAQRCKTITENLLSFSRQSESCLTLVNIKDLLDRTLELIGVQLRHKQLLLTIDIEPGLRPITADANQLQQVFTNIILNAVYFSEPGENVVIAASQTSNNCLLTFSDNGSGIAQEHLDNVFNPFFTTKPVGKGTGLGLSIAYGIIQKHGGEISVDSVLGQGTTFKLLLPVKVKHEQ